MNKPVIEQFTKEQLSEIKSLWIQGKTQDEIGQVTHIPRRTVMKLCKILGCKRTPKEASTIKSPIDNQQIIEKIKELRNTHSLEEIVIIVGGSPSAINRLCKKYDIKLDKESFACAQSARMTAVWTQEKRSDISGSKYVQLNDNDWLTEHYITKDMSMGAIAKLIGAPLMTVSHHLRRHGIQIKTKEQYLRNLRRSVTEHRIIDTKWGSFNVQTEIEAEFLRSLGDEVGSVEYEPTTFEYMGSQYTPDFRVDGNLIEIKPPEYAIKPGIDRQRFVKQSLVALRCGVAVKVWHPRKGYYNTEPISDNDKYFCLNWKLVFDSSNACFDFLVNFGFHSLQWEKDKLLFGLKNLFKAEGENRLNANYQNQTVVDLIKHFNPHFWSSTRKNELSIRAAFELGNRSVLRSALDMLWAKPNNVNIYGLVALIAKKYKDFKIVSIFKPWVARFIYDELLPTGGVVVDPCMGWGGRLLGVLDSNIRYIGFDRNPNVIEAHRNIRKFIGTRLIIEPEFNLADSASVIWPKGDLIFTSPPYDDTEYYDGLLEQCIDTKAIYKNIMKFSGLVALNVPRRHREECVIMARDCGRELIREFSMKTNNPQLVREKADEPILVFS